MAAKLQQDAERSRVRGLVYHLALQHGKGVSGAQTVTIENEINTLEQIPASARNAALNELIDNKRKDLIKLSRPSPIAFNDLAQHLANQGKDFDYKRRLSSQCSVSTSSAACRSSVSAANR